VYLGCSSQSYDDALRAGRLTLAEWLRLAAEELGLEAVELEDKHIGEPTPVRLNELRATAARYGLQIVNIAFMNDFGVADDARRRGEEDRTVAWMDVSRRLGSRYLRTFAGWPEGERRALWPAMLRALRAVCARAEAAGVRLVMENHNHRGFVQTAGDVEAILGHVGSPALGLLLDTGNYLDGAQSIARTAALAWHVHAKFTSPAPDGRDRHVDHDEVLGILRAAGYAGCVSVEYEGEEPGASAVPRIVSYLRRAMDP
jgi:L-ribulose-5-phosphate 3-epimerase